MPFAPQPRPPTTDLRPLQLLVAPFPELSGDGQLRELMFERRRHQGIGDAGLWYCPPSVSSMLGVVARPSGIDLSGCSCGWVSRYGQCSSAAARPPVTMRLAAV